MLTPAWSACFGQNLCFSSLRHFTVQTIQRSHWQVSSFGRYCDTRGSISEGYLHPSGHRIMGMAGHRWRVHRVVKITFHGLPPCDNTWQVHHRDGNPLNNRLDNLEFVSASENVTFSFADPTRGRGATPKPLLWRPVGSDIWTSSPSILAAAKHLGMDADWIARCARNNSESKGFQFRFEDLSDQCLPGEEWRTMLNPNSGEEVPGRMVSSFGRIRSLRGVVSSGYQAKSGYSSTTVIGQTLLVHRIVLCSFRGPPPSPRHTQVNHIDGNKSNNHVANLEYVTPGENLTHHFTRVGVGSKIGKHTAQCKPVWSRCWGSDDEWKWHSSIKNAAVVLGLRQTGVSACIRGTIRQSGGYEFRLANSDRRCLPGEEWCPVDLQLLLEDRIAIKAKLHKEGCATFAGANLFMIWNMFQEFLFDSWQLDPWGRLWQDMSADCSWMPDVALALWIVQHACTICWWVFPLGRESCSAHGFRVWSGTKVARLRDGVGV